jgi:hypothetical protein
MNLPSVLGPSALQPVYPFFISRAVILKAHSLDGCYSTGLFSAQPEQPILAAEFAP